MEQQEKYSKMDLEIIYYKYLNECADFLANYEMFETERGTYKYFTKEQFIDKLNTNDLFYKKWYSMLQQTPVEWLMDKLKFIDRNTYNTIYEDYFSQAKELEKKQIMKTAIQCHFEGVRQSMKTIEEYIAYGEQYYNETYKNKE